MWKESLEVGSIVYSCSRVQERCSKFLDNPCLKLSNWKELRDAVLTPTQGNSQLGKTYEVYYSVHSAKTIYLLEKGLILGTEPFNSCWQDNLNLLCKA